MKFNYKSSFIIALFLSLPVIILYAAQFISAYRADRWATLFNQYDMFYYMANARQYIDGQNNGIAYSNPYDLDINSPCIYFQPQTLFLGLILRVTSLDPGLLFALFGIASMIIAFILLQKFIDEYCLLLPGKLRLYLIFLVSWGGGMLALSGFIVSHVKGIQANPFLFDPAMGGWFLNLGRNFTYPTEAFYHMIVIFLFTLVLLKRMSYALGILFFLVMAHPFTGIQYSMILLSWVLFERFVMNSKLFKAKDIILFSLPFILAILYYLIFLPLFPSHLALQKQWSLAWSLKVPTIMGAYAIVGILVMIRCSSIDRFKYTFSDPFSRFLGVSAVVSFLLANHDLFIDPKQPIHFTRGHIWLPLCLLSLPLIVNVWGELKDTKWKLFLVSSLFMAILVFDNVVFFISNYPNPPVVLPKSLKKVLNYLAERQDSPIIISDDPMFMLSYMSATYSTARPYLGHKYNTPDSQRKEMAIVKLLDYGIIPKELEHKKFLVIIHKNFLRIATDKRFTHIFTGGRFKVFERNLSINSPV